MSNFIEQLNNMSVTSELQTEYINVPQGHADGHIESLEVGFKAPTEEGQLPFYYLRGMVKITDVAVAEVTKRDSSKVKIFIPLYLEKNSDGSVGISNTNIFFGRLRYAIDFTGDVEQFLLDILNVPLTFVIAHSLYNERVSAEVKDVVLTSLDDSLSGDELATEDDLV